MTRMTLVALALAATAGTARAEKWEIDSSHTNAHFSVKHMMVSNVQGDLGKVSGTVDLEGKDPTKAAVDVSIDVSGINTREPKRDGHLKSPDFFDVAKYPTITFKSKKIVKSKSGYNLEGDLTIHGVTKDVTLAMQNPTPEMKDPWGGIRVGAVATTKINRKDFGLVWNKALEAGGVVVGDEVAITLDVELMKKAPAAAAK